MLAAFLANGYEVVTFRRFLEDPGRQDRVLVLRHDVDIDPTPLLRMTDVERALGVRSTIFVRPDAAGYDLDATTPIWRGLDRDGFEIGLHYDSDGAEPAGDVRSQRARLEAALGFTVEGAASHRVATTGWSLEGSARQSLGLAYDATEVTAQNQLKYISDSRRRWREQCFCHWLGREDRLQVLVHAEWWQPGSLRRMDELLALL